MKGFLSSAAIAAVLFSSSGVVDAFAPASRRVAVAKVHNNYAPPSPLSFGGLHQRLLVPTRLHTSNSDGSSVDEDVVEERPRLSRSLSAALSSLRRRSKPLALALLTATSLRSFGPNSSFLRPLPASASAPIVLRPSMKKDDPPMVKAQKQAETLRKKRQMEEFDAFMAKCNDIEEKEGKAARDAFEKQYHMEKEAAEIQKKKDIIKLKRDLLDAGQDYHTDLDAERQVFLMEHDVDLEKVMGTPQNELMTKTFLKKKGQKGQDVGYQKNQRYIIACQVADLKARGIDPMEHFADGDVMDKTRAIYKMDDRVAEKVASQYRSLMEKHGGRLTPAQPGETPFVYSEEAEGTTAAGSAAVAGANAKEERAAAKAKLAAEKEAAKKEKAEARARAKEERSAAKKAQLAEKAAAKEARAVERAAAKAAKDEAAAAATATPTSASEVMADDDVAATADGDVFAVAGHDAGAVDAAAAELSATAAQQASSSSGSKKDDIVKSIKTYATPKNVATVVVGGAAINYGVNYYRENNSATQSERERQLKLILGETDDDDEEDDDEEEDEDDEYDQFAKKKPEPPETKPKADIDEPKAKAKPTPPPPPPVAPPKPKRKLGIFAKRNADARETDLNAMVAPTAQAPEFATLLAKILTFGAPGRFPVVSSWGDMPFETFDLDMAKALLTEAREDADLTDEQSAEIFANVVNCMIIDIVDLASATLKVGKDKKDEKVTVDAINVVMDFMDHAAGLFDAVAKDVTIKPVTYGGTLRKKDLEQMFSIYAGSSMMSLDALSGTGSSQDRVDTLQLVFGITDKKAEGLMQKHMMKMMMNLMKDGGKGMEGMPGMEGMEEMMKAMGGMEGMGMPGMDGEVSPEELKQTLGMMKELMDSGQVSEDELAEVRKQFKEMYGSDISDLIKKANAEGAGEGMTADERELLDLFKKILGE